MYTELVKFTDSRQGGSKNYVISQVGWGGEGGGGLESAHKVQSTLNYMGPKNAKNKKRLSVFSFFLEKNYYFF